MEMLQVCSEYLTDREYEVYWFELGGLRRAIGRDLGLSDGMKILDVGTGWGLFAIEMAKLFRKGEVVGIDITPEVDTARKFTKRYEVADIVEILKTDATNLCFLSDSFDLAVSFLGMRDIHMTRGEKGVEKAVQEMIRVTKLGGRIALCITPPEDMETQDQRLAVEVEGEVFGAKSLPKEFFMNIFQDNHVKLTETKAYYTRKKLTAHQVRVELEEGIAIARRVYNRNVPDFEDVWREYGERIETFGYGMYSKIILLVGKKSARS